MKYIYISIIALLAILLRTTFKIAPNIELISSLSFISGLLLYRSKLSFLPTFLVMLITDLIIGNTQIFLFTWTGFLFPIVLGSILNKKGRFLKGSYKEIYFNSLLISIITTLFFFIWTNLGVVIVSDMYNKNLQGLILSYINAIPFLRLQLIGNMIIMPIMSILTKLALELDLIKTLRIKAQ